MAARTWRWRAGAVLAAGFVACIAELGVASAAPRATQDDARRWSDLLAREYDALLRERPSLATELGEHIGLHRWEDLSPAAALRALAERHWRDALRFHPSLALAQGEPSARSLFDHSLEDGWRADLLRSIDADHDALAMIDPGALGDEDRTTYRVLRYELERDLRFYGSALFETARRLPLDPFQGQHLAYAADAAGAGAAPYRSVDDYEQALARADAFARWVDAAIGRMREGMRMGVVLPAVLVDRLLPQLEQHFGRAPELTDFWKPIAALPADVSPADRVHLEEQYRDAIATVIEPAFARLYRFLHDEYRPQARRSVGLDRVPGGAELYRYLVRYHTSTTLAPEAIHALGRAEVQRLDARLASVRDELGFHGSTAAFLASIREDPARHFSSPDEVIPAFTAARDRIVGRLPRLFDAVPNAAFEIRALPDSARENAGNGYYSAPAADRSRPGILWVNVHSPGVMDRGNVTTIALHEGLPGHHFAIALAQEQARLPSFRRYSEYTAFAEGWALYAESLGRELGVFDDPWQYVGHLNYALLRANRLVIDTGIHTRGWDIRRAVDWMLAHSSLTQAAAQAEVERYVAYPAQALAYKIGELRIRALRTRAERELGSRFDIRAFHDAVLLSGGLPLDVLEERVGEWINRQAAAAGASRP